MTRPLIGITSEMTAARWGDWLREAVLLPADYAWSLQRAGCVPVLLPPMAHDAAGLAARLDAVVFADGGDIADRRGGAGPAGPAPGAAPEPDQARDSSEFALMRATIGAGIPVLAVGRGMWVLNAVRGGSVAEGGQAAAPTGPQVPRAVRISPDSRLGRLLGPAVTVPAAEVPGGGHRALDRIGTGLTAVAWTDDQAVAAIELTGPSFAIGMRWHPGDDDEMRIFTELAAAASNHAAAA
jgi:gamma-glutamyl-gamma-aminobutyrate hydrolase PuuD